MSKRVLSVGQCGPDNSTLTAYLKKHFDVAIDYADLPADTAEKLRGEPYDLVLINRKLDADYSDGMEILKAIKADPETKSVPVMLISNYEEHQQAAIACGACPGFGKLEYAKPQTLERIRAVLA